MGKRKEKYGKFIKIFQKVTSLIFSFILDVLSIFKKNRLFIGLLVKSLVKRLLHFVYMCIIKYHCCKRHLMRNHLNESVGNNSTGLNKYLYKLTHFYPSTIGRRAVQLDCLCFLRHILSNAYYYLNTAQKL